jgi:hypothetical protein
MAAFESLQGKWEKKNVAKRGFKYYYVPVKNLIHHDGWNVPRRLKWEQLKERLW